MRAKPLEVCKVCNESDEQSRASYTAGVIPFVTGALPRRGLLFCTQTTSVPRQQHGDCTLTHTRKQERVLC